MNNPARTSALNFYTTPPHGCSYLPPRQAVTLFADPGIPKTDAVYGLLSAHGFRRSGEHLYRPHCQGCRACVAVRLLVNRFQPSRNQRRTLEINADLQIRGLPAHFNQEHFELYQRYIAGRHAGGGMDNPSPQQYLDFLTAEWCNTRFIEFRLGTQLLAVAVVDVMADALSAVYTFYDPEHHRRSLGKFAVLQEIASAQAENRQWLYLGYWIANCRKMRYKIEYQPLEYFWNGSWTSTRPLPVDATTAAALD